MSRSIRWPTRPRNRSGNAVHYIASGLLLGSAVALFQEGSRATVDWTPIVIAFFTGAFGSNGLAKIIESLWNTRTTGTLKKQLEESKRLYDEATLREKSCQERISKLQHDMNEQHKRHQADIEKLRRDLRGRL